MKITSKGIVCPHDEGVEFSVRDNDSKDSPIREPSAVYFEYNRNRVYLHYAGVTGEHTLPMFEILADPDHLDDIADALNYIAARLRDR